MGQSHMSSLRHHLSLMFHQSLLSLQRCRNACRELATTIKCQPGPPRLSPNKLSNRARHAGWNGKASSTCESAPFWLLLMWLTRCMILIFLTNVSFTSISVRVVCRTGFHCFWNETAGGLKVHNDQESACNMVCVWSLILPR